MQNLKKMQQKACLISLGCKVNKYEIDSMATILSEFGYDISFEMCVADVYIINTCAVTNEAEKKSRQYISKISKLNLNAKIIVCGCASEHNVAQFEKKNVFSIIGNANKENILEILNIKTIKVFKHSLHYDSVSNPHKAHTRAYLKVQDGCNNFCSYCLIPYVRGRSRSRDINEIIEEAKNLSQTSAEIVITGIDLSSFKINNKNALGELIYSLKNINSRIRLGSLEVNVINEEFLQLLLNTKNFCPHFHLSLQSGSNSELKRMNRHYTTNEYLQKVELIRKYFPTANITTDIIVGFPEQSDEEFNETLETVKKAKFVHAHVFPYSLREGTAASKLKQVLSNIKKERVAKLTQVCKNIEHEYLLSLVGSTFTMLSEDNKNNMLEGYTENYIKCYLPNSNLKSNLLIKVKILKPYLDGVICELVKEQ